MKPDNLEHLKLGGIGIIPTDTIYGVVGQALRPKVVERIYNLKGRTASKPFIILISSLEDLQKFKVYLTPDEKKFLNKYWPGAISVILPVPYDELQYLHRGEKTLAFRLPNKPDLIEVIKEVGPLVAPSANPEGATPATNIYEAKDYFGIGVDFYEDGGTLESTPSTLVFLANGEVEVIRQGKVVISEAINEEKKPENEIIEEKVEIRKIDNSDYHPREDGLPAGEAGDPVLVKTLPDEEKIVEPSKIDYPIGEITERLETQMTTKEKILYASLFLASLLILVICILIR